MSEISVYLCHDCSKSLGASFFSRNQLNKFTHGHSSRLSCQDCCAKRYADTNPQKKKAKISAEEKGALGKADGALNADVNYSKIEPPQALQPANPPKLSKNAIKLNRRQSLDPSIQYLENPFSAPIVRDAKKFFQMNYQQPTQIFMQSKTHWRTHVKLAVRAHFTGNSNQVATKIGLFIPNSHNILECLDHPAHHETINHTLNLLKQCMETNQIHGYIEGQDYDEKQVNRLSLYVKYVVLTHTHTNNRIQMTLVINTHPSNKLAETRLLQLRDSLVEQGKGVFHSIFLNYFVSNKHNNSILGRERDLYHLVYGEEYILEDLHIYHSNNNALSSLHVSKHTQDRKVASSSNVLKLTVNYADMRLHIVPFVFRQANLDAFCQIIKKLREHMQGLAIAKASVNASNSPMHMPNTPLLPHASIGPSSLNCLELYGGIGTIGLHLLDLCHAYVCSDENPHNKKCFELSLDLIRDKDTGVANLPYSYIPLSAEQMVQRVDVRRCITGTDSEREAYDVIIVDPPRKGLDDKVIEALLEGNEDASASTSKRKKRKLDENGSDDDANCTKIKKKQVLYYISCGFEALKRDLQHLTGVSMSDEYLAWKSAKPHHSGSQTSSNNAGGGGEIKQKNSGSVWTIEQVFGFILFPGANHLETFVTLTRNV